MTAAVASPLSPRQQRILNVIRDHQAAHGYAPSLRDIGEQVGLASASTVKYQVGELVRKGWLRRTAGVSRALTVLEPDGGVHPLVVQLADLRRAAGVDRAVVADRVGVRAAHFQRWENGSYRPGLVKFQVWAEVLGCAVAVCPRSGIPLLGDPVEVLIGLRRRRGGLVLSAGVTLWQVEQWERRTTAPTLDTVTLWADALGCDLRLVPSALVALAVAA